MQPAAAVYRQYDDEWRWGVRLAELGVAIGQPLSMIYAEPQKVNQKTVSVVLPGWGWQFEERDMQPKEVFLYASAARTATPTATDQDNIEGYRGLIVFIDMTAAGSSPSTTFTIQGKEPYGDEYYDILASAAQTSTGNVVLKVFPGATASANTVANDHLPRIWRVSCAHGNTTSHTYSVTACLLP